jgi:hypothetical protein
MARAVMQSVPATSGALRVSLIIAIFLNQTVYMFLLNGKQL